MSGMSHTAAANANLTHGILLEAKPDSIILGLPGTDYQLHLALADPLPPELTPGPTALVTGTIKAKARRMDVVRTGGRYIEPVYGRPRRVQGSIISLDASDNTIIVHCAPGCVVDCTLMAGQRAADFAIGALVSFDVERGATFARA
jgi:hypothetical protein